ncbi:MAG: ATPase, P-type (transporting), superfamily, subfamily, partial [Bacteroidetes bacterium]|nr:ATPase, P-type (transporting), superfamily, subfamily [Bacteroidota bacterium]
MMQEALILPGTPHALPVEQVLVALGSRPQGLTSAEALARLVQHGRNALPRPKPPGVLKVFLRQFLSPLIYILLFAAAISLFLGDWSDAGFIAAVLLVNAVIGGIQEYGAEKSAEALRALVASKARVIRDGEDFEVDAEELVPGDVVLIESGMKVPADLRLLSSASLEADESLLTGESLPVAKDPDQMLDGNAVVADRVNMAFAGTLVTRGRASGVVFSTGIRTQLGDIATSVAGADSAKPPLLVRMDRFTRRIALAIGVAVIILGAASLARGSDARDVFFMAVALAVSAIPEGLPVALTVALSIGARRMSRRRVIARRLVAVEALGSCTFIASDKTGTLTLNEMTSRKVLFAGQVPWDVTGEGTVPEGEILVPSPVDAARGRALVERLVVAVTLCNDGFLGRRDSEWTSHGDAVDIALLVLAHKAGVIRPAVEAQCPRRAEIPFEAERRFAATLNRCVGRNQVFVKGASERVLHMCNQMATVGGDVPIDMAALEDQANALASGGYRVLAVASGTVGIEPGEEFAPETLTGLVFLGYVGMIDPLRPEARVSMIACRQAGIEVAMVTGDHPVTAFAIARELGFADRMDQVVTGLQLRAAAGQGESAVDDLTRGVRVFARVEPQQKLEIVKSLMRLGHFVAVTGDGANDAPALRAANIGVAMGLRGTDIARETADLILTDDNFASIAAGVEEGRIAYANVRKVIFLLISTGAAEVFLFFLAIAA